MTTTIEHNSIIETIADFLAPRLRERRLDAERRAETDALTGLASRAAFDKAEVSASRDSQTTFIIFDANNFKFANDRISHAEGDKLLQFYADVIENEARKYKARAFRIGGDEFVIICGNQFAERVRNSVELRAVPRRFEDFTVSLSGEIGSTLTEADSKLQARKNARKATDCN